MIIVKLVLIVSLCYLIGRGLSRELEREADEAKKQTKDIRNKSKEAYQLMQAEKRVLVNTINELREEIDTLKKLNRRLK
jgi:hypothetical protein